MQRSKKELAHYLVAIQESFTSEQEALHAITAVCAGIEQSLWEGRDVSLPGFGKFSVKQRAARQGRNPSTGEPMQIPEATAVSFKVSAALKKKLNETD